MSYLGRINHNEYSYFYYCFPAKICLVCLLPSLNPVDPITHCSDAAVDAQILRGALGSGKAEHSPKGVGYCSIPEILHHHVLVPLRSAQKFLGPYSVLHAFRRNCLDSIIIPFLDLRLKSSHFLQNDRQDDLFQEITVLLSHLQEPQEWC